MRRVGGLGKGGSMGEGGCCHCQLYIYTYICIDRKIFLYDENEKGIEGQNKLCFKAKSMFYDSCFYPPPKNNQAMALFSDS